MFRTTVTMMGLALALCGCGDDGDVTPMNDAGGTVIDSGTPGTDSGPRRMDAGPADECAAEPEDAISTVGCNGGFVSGEFAANGPFGACTPDETEQAGSCTTPNAACNAAEGETEGACLVLCPPSSSYVTAGDCPTGYRCFAAAAEYGLCYRDCDATHACPTGWECDGEGSCLRGDEPEVDGGTTSDGGVVDGGADAGTDVPPAK